MERIIGLDFDGVLHDSLGNAVIATNQSLTDHSLPPITTQNFREAYGSDWPEFFGRIGVPKELHPIWYGEFHKRYDVLNDGSLVPGARELMDYLEGNYNPQNIVIITNESRERVLNFAVQHFKRRSEVYRAKSCKSDLFDQIGITDFVSDSVSDGESCLRAKSKPRFIGVGHEYAYNTHAKLLEFKSQNPESQIEIVQSLEQVRRFI